MAEDVGIAETLEERVRQALNGIVDPCSASAGAPAGLADMGLVRNVEVSHEDAGAQVDVLLAVTHPSCMMAPVFLAQAQQRLTAIPEVCSVQVRLDADFEWSPAELSAAYREELAAQRQRVGRHTSLPTLNPLLQGGDR